MALKTSGGDYNFVRTHIRLTHAYESNEETRLSTGHLQFVAAMVALKTGQSLRSGESFTCGDYTFIMQGDCDLVLYKKGVALWASNTAGKAAQHSAVCLMQSDGNLVIYSVGRPIWASNTNRAHGVYALKMQADGNVVIYGPESSNGFQGPAIWATNTVNKR